MVFDEKVYNTLVVSSSEKFNDIIQRILYGAHCDPITFTDSIASAKRLILENQYDYVIINAPLPDEFGTKLAIDVSSGKSSVCLMFIKAELHAEIRSKVTPYGVFTLTKPTSSAAITLGLNFMASARERLRNLENKTVSIEDKMEEIRLVNRAKWVLIQNLKMTEPDAHRYIEKQAMDTCTTRLEIAKEIIKTYT